MPGEIELGKVHGHPNPTLLVESMYMAAGDSWSNTGELYHSALTGLLLTQHVTAEAAEHARLPGACDIGQKRGKASNLPPSPAPL